MAESTPHPAERLTERLPVVFTAQPAESAYLREKICAFVLRSGAVPVNPFMALGYFLYDLVERDVIRLANNNLIARCDELWVFGEVADGVDVEIRLANERGMPVRRFLLDHYGDDIRELRE